MDEQTQGYYAAFSEEIADRYDSIESPMTRFLARAFDNGARVLDIGAGSGRDLTVLRELGCDAYGVEPSDQLRNAAIRRHPELAGRLAPGQLPNLGEPFGVRFDGVLCSAVLMHLPKAEILDAAISIRDVLRENGKLLLSVPRERPELDAADRDRHGRLFTPLAPDYLQLLFERIGFQLLERWQSKDELGREGYSWCTFLFQARHPGGSRPLDLIEGILNRDRKTATYKLALFRALAEIATTEFEQARWVGSEQVAIPVSAICDRWVYYYWPIFEAAVFVPQIRGETPTCRMPVAFRASLAGLVALYRNSGGLARFVLDSREGKLSEVASRIRQHTLVQIRTTVVKGPVTYAGGSLETGRVFQYDSRSQEIRMSAALWRELSLLGHWIQDAVILRWAELTSEIAKRAIRPSEVVDLLLTVPIPERDVTEARATYRALGSVECTWTGVALRRDFDVDHIIPFSLWHNNELWNLVPAAPQVNSAKSDKLPTRELMHRRRDRIIGYWEILHDKHNARFAYEAARVTGRERLPVSWQPMLFQAVYDSVEFTAAQRGYERWEP